jgi:hypothetical protein
VTPTTTKPKKAAIPIPHFVQGRLLWGDDVEHLSRDLGVPLVTPRLQLGDLFVPRSEPGPAFDVPLAEIIDFLVETGRHLVLETNPYLQESLEMTVQVSSLPRRIIENTFRRPGQFLTREAIEYKLERCFGDSGVLDGWVEHTDPHGNTSRVRAFPPRLVHMLAGNSPSAAMTSIADAAMVKAVNVFKMPSADPFTTVAVLRTMSDIAPDHPVLRSISAVYWRGGDSAVEGVLYRSQFFDKLVAWGGGEAITNAAQYVGPGFQLIAFDPKVSMAIVGKEAFATEGTLEEVADLAAADATVFNQDACVAPRQIFVEGEAEQVDRFCSVLCDRLGVDREFASAVGPLPSSEVRDAVDGVRFLEPDYRVWGSYDGRGLVVRSPEPMDFHPSDKTVNVIPVTSAREAIAFATVATQTVGVYPATAKSTLRDGLAAAGVQRVVRLGSALRGSLGNPHDAMYPLHRFVNWVVDDDA